MSADLLLAFAVWFALAGTAFLLAAERIWARIRRRPAPHLLKACLLAIMLGPAFPLIHVPFLWVSASQKVLRNEDRYLAAISVIDAGGTTPLIRIMDPGPPRRFAFIWGNVGAEWWGVVHDQTQTFDDNATTVFGIDIARRIHLWGPWYYVSYG